MPTTVGAPPVRRKTSTAFRQAGAARARVRMRTIRYSGRSAGRGMARAGRARGRSQRLRPAAAVVEAEPLVLVGLRPSPGRRPRRSWRRPAPAAGIAPRRKSASGFRAPEVARQDLVPPPDDDRAPGAPPPPGARKSASLTMARMASSENLDDDAGRPEGVLGLHALEGRVGELGLPAVGVEALPLDGPHLGDRPCTRCVPGALPDPQLTRRSSGWARTRRCTRSRPAGSGGRCAAAPVRAAAQDRGEVLQVVLR